MTFICETPAEPRSPCCEYPTRCVRGLNGRFTSRFMGRSCGARPAPPAETRGFDAAAPRPAGGPARPLHVSS